MVGYQTNGVHAGTGYSGQRPAFPQQGLAKKQIKNRGHRRRAGISFNERHAPFIPRCVTSAHRAAAPPNALTSRMMGYFRRAAG